MGHICSLSYNDISNPYIHTLNTELTELELIRDKLEFLPDILGELQALFYLNLSHNFLKEISVLSYSQIKTLVLSNNYLESVPHGLENCCSLVKLDLSGNDIKNICSLGSLTNLESLDLSNNAFSLDNSVIFPQSLQEINLSGNFITKLPPSTGNLYNLKRFDVSNNGIRSIDILFDISSLLELDVSNNKIEELLPDIANFQNLVKFDISGNRILLFPTSLLQMKNLKEFHFFRNPIDSGIIERYCNTLDIVELISDMYPNLYEYEEKHRIKIFFFVNPDSANSKIYTHFLSGSQQNEKEEDRSCDSFDIYYKLSSEKKKKNVHLDIWDFKGNTEYFISQESFINDRTIFIITWNILSNSDIDIYLKAIRSRVKNPCILIIGTHVDLINRKQRHQILKEKTDEIQIILNRCDVLAYINFWDGTNASLLKKEIENFFTSQRYLGEQIPFSYIQCEKYILRRRSYMDFPVISRIEFLRIIELCGIDPNLINRVAGYLANYGVILYNSKDVNMSNHIILDPLWASNIFTSMINYSADGMVPISSLTKAWASNSIFLFPKIINFLVQSELAYEISSGLIDSGSIRASLKVNKSEMSGYILLPWLVKIPAVNKWIGGQSEFKKVFHFSHIPPTFASRFVVRVLSLTQYHTDIESYFWDGGFYVKKSDFEIQMTRRERNIEIQVRGETRICANMLSYISESCQCFVSSFSNVEVKEYAVCPMCIGEFPEGSQHEFPIDILVHKVNRGEYGINCPHHSLEIVDLLPDTAQLKEIPQISYASDIRQQELIHEGLYNSVSKGLLGETTVALKVLKGITLSPLELKTASMRFNREMLYLSQFDSDYILRLLGINISKNIIVLEYAQYGNLDDYLKTETMSHDMRIKILKDVSSGLKYLHSLTIRYINLNRHNIMVTSTNEKEICAKLTDFSYASSENNLNNLSKSRYLSPEILSNLPYGFETDIFSFGLLMYEIFTSKIFFGQITRETVLHRAVIDGRRPDIPEKIDNDVRNMIQRCWSQNRLDRPKLGEVRKSLSALSEKIKTVMSVLELTHCFEVLLKQQQFTATPTNSVVLEGVTVINNLEEEGYTAEDLIEEDTRLLLFVMLEEVMANVSQGKPKDILDSLNINYEECLKFPNFGKLVKAFFEQIRIVKILRKGNLVEFNPDIVLKTKRKQRSYINPEEDQNAPKFLEIFTKSPVVEKFIASKGKDRFTASSDSPNSQNPSHSYHKISRRKSDKGSFFLDYKRTDGSPVPEISITESRYRNKKKKSGKSPGRKFSPRAKKLIHKRSSPRIGFEKNKPTKSFSKKMFKEYKIKNKLQDIEMSINSEKDKSSLQELMEVIDTEKKSEDLSKIESSLSQIQASHSVDSADSEDSVNSEESDRDEVLYNISHTELNTVIDGAENLLNLTVVLVVQLKNALVEEDLASFEIKYEKIGKVLKLFCNSIDLISNCSITGKENEQKEIFELMRIIVASVYGLRKLSKKLGEETTETIQETLLNYISLFASKASTMKTLLLDMSV
eukprot:TRINITY_DN12742_c0_g1_i1.p1 TRINITY_DN12742_c0_g1~~TRINITY_DN12742_c0_g1_i1.p1  ORF type:complete len:1541 (+),score=289.00 TRINITY_DN12742_c0_g1_i1:95-4624(+)